jgi:hypothetical protein
MKRQQEKQEVYNVVIFSCSGMSAILRKSFAVLILWYFLIKKKVRMINSFGEHASFVTFLEFTPMNIGAKKS